MEEVKELLGKGAIREVHNPRGGFYSKNGFLVPKKDGRQRPVINLKALNSLVYRAFQDGGNPHPQRPCQSRGLDGQGGSEGGILILQSQSTNLTTNTQILSVPLLTIWPVIGSLGLYQDPEAGTSSPSGDGGANDSVHRRHRDPGEVPGASKQPCGGIGVSLAVLGFQSKPVLNPAQVMEFLGFTVDTVQMELKLPVDKIKKIRVESRAILIEEQVSGRAVVRLATSQVIPPDPLFYRHLQMAMSPTLNQHSQCYEAMVSLTMECRED